MGSDDFARAIAKIAVAQICENEGFQSFQQSALEALADVAIRYIREIGKTSNRHANLDGRSECNVFDIIQGLEELGSIQGFPGASDVHHNLASSGTIKEIKQYVSLVEEIPFAYSLPKFPFSREHKPPISFSQFGVDPPEEHVPPWLPAFPCPETCPNAPISDGAEGRREKNGSEEQVKVHGLEKPAQQQLAANNGFQANFVQNPGDTSKMERTVDINPFLAPPMMYGEKEVSLIDLPPRLWQGGAAAYHVTETEAFAPVIGAAQNKLSGTEDRDKSIRTDGRPTVQLKFSRVRKPLASPVNVFTQKDAEDKLANGFGRDDEKSEQRRTAELILNESMEKPLDSTQL